MPTYSYANCLANAYKVNWRIEEVLGTRRFDPTKRWLPRSLSASQAISFLSDGERRALTHVELSAYAHLFGYVEEFIAPKVSALARDYEIDQRVAFDALTSFAAEEVKHMNLFRAVRDRVDEELGLRLARLGGEAETARFVLGQSTAAVMLLTSAIEWLTQRHYLDAFKDDADLDPLIQAIFKAHWLEESQHAQLDHLETMRAFGALDEAGRERAVDELIALVTAVDGLLRQQVEHDVENFARLLGRQFDTAQIAELHRELLRAKRWTFILSGVTHPRFDELFHAVTTPAQRERVGAALEALFADPMETVG